MIRKAEIEELKRYLKQINDVKLSKILSLSYFSVAYSDHLNKTEFLNIDELFERYKETNISKKDIETLCRICDFLNRNLLGYVPIVKDKIFNISFDYVSDYDNYFVNHSVIIQSNLIDIEKVITTLISNELVFDKLNDDEFIIDKCKTNTIHIKEQNILREFLSTKEQKIKFVGKEEELDKLVDLFDSLTSYFAILSDSYFLVNAICLIISLLPSGIKSARVSNLTRRTQQISFDKKKDVLKFFEENKITKLTQLSNLKYQNVKLDILESIALIMQHNNFWPPKVIQDYVFSLFKEKDQLYASMRYEKCMKYAEIGEELGISRAGAQAALAKIEKELSQDEFKNHMIELLEQILLFRNNDYYIFTDLLEQLGIWRGLIEDIFSLYEYKNSGFYIIDGLIPLQDSNEDSEENQELLDYRSKEYQFDFILNLPNVIKKNELNKYIDSIIENSEKVITKNDVKAIIDLNYRDYNIVISKTKLNISYFMKQILEKYYPNGLDVYDSTNLNKIRNLLKELYNYSIDEYGDRYITHRICLVATLIGRGVWKYIPEQVELSDEFKNKINDYIENYPITAVPIKSIYDHFAEDFMDCGIENKYAFQGIIRKSINPKYKVTKDYIYTDDSQTYVEIVADFIKNSDILVTKDVLEKQFPGFSITSMQRIINTSSVVNMNGYFASMENFNFTQEEISNLKSELENIVQDGETHNSKNIYYRFRGKFNGLFNRIGINHYLQLYYILNKLFDDDFEFLRPFIAKKGIEIQDKETQLVALVVQEEKVTIERLRILASKVGYFMESIMDFVIRNNDEIVFLDENHIVAINKIEINEEKMAQIDTILDKFMLYSNYRYLSDLAKYSEIEKICPFANKWFLYSIVSVYSTKYKVFRTSNVMSRTDLVIAKEDFNIDEVKEEISSNFELADLEDLLDIEDLE